MNTTNIKEGSLIVCVNTTMPSYLKIAEIVRISHIPNDGAIESITISYRKSHNDSYKNIWERVITETIPYRDFEFNFKKINCETAY